MNRIFLFLFLFLGFGLNSHSQVLQNIVKTIKNSSGQALSQEEVAKGLKEALSIGSNNAGALANKTNGYFANPKIKIPFPNDVNYAVAKLKQLGMSKLVDDFVLTLNRSAETAAKEASPIFVNAIKQMSITDAISILKGGENAATQYLQNTTRSNLFTAFIPHIKLALAKTGATKNWTKITTSYNKVPLVTPIQTDLAKYTTDKALDGLFYLVSQEELKIRKDPAARVTDLLKKIFG